MPAPRLNPDPNAIQTAFGKEGLAITFSSPKGELFWMLFPWEQLEPSRVAVWRKEFPTGNLAVWSDANGLTVRVEAAGACPTPPVFIPWKEVCKAQKSK